MSFLPTRDEVSNWQRIPCLRESLLRGVGGGLLVGVLWGLRRSSAKSLGDAFFLSTGAIATCSWLLCRHNDNVRRASLSRAMLAQSRSPDIEVVNAERLRAAEMAERAAYGGNNKDDDKDSIKDDKKRD
jgi:predicted lipid-binding transport protein (Tim44 family)